MSFDTSQIRNVVLTGHTGTGKTTLLDQILFNTDTIKKAENLKSGKTVSDYTPEEIEKQFSFYTTMSHFNWNKNKINIFDTPGSSSFVGEVIETFRATESAIVVVDGKNSVQIETIKLWRRLNDRNMPRAVFVNKMDAQRADFKHVMEDLKHKFKKICVPITMPIGEGSNYKGIVNLIEMKAYLVHDKNAKDISSEIPEDFKKDALEMRETMIELAAEGDDALIEIYFDKGTLSEQQIIKGLTLGMRNNRIVPVLAGSAVLNNGIASLLNFICTASPSPKDIHEMAITKDKQPLDIHIDSSKPFSAFCFKTKYDQFSGKLSYVKVITGKLTPETEIMNFSSNKKEKLHKIFNIQGPTLHETTELKAGDIGVITKIDSLQTNNTICDPSLKYNFHTLKLPQPIHSLAIWADNKKDDDKMNVALHKVAEEDRTFILRFNGETYESVVSGMGELHLNIILNKVREKQKIVINTKAPKIAYRETITRSSQAEYTHKKQSGGHGQFGKIVMTMEPAQDGVKYEFKNSVKGGSISKGYMPGIEKGFQEGMKQGFLAGFPIVNVKFTITDGKEHPVDSSEMSFKLAAKGALKEAMSKAGASLLEPIMMLKVFADDKYMGDILSDISSKRGKIIGQESLGGDISEIDAEIPQAELLSYAIDLKSMTSGTGSFEMHFIHYSVISGKLAKKIIIENKKEEEVV